MLARTTYLLYKTDIPLNYVIGSNLMGLFLLILFYVYSRWDDYKISFYEDFFHQSQDIYVVRNAKFTKVYSVNNTLLKLLGVTMDELKNMDMESYLSIIHPDDISNFIKRIDHANYKPGEPQNLVIRIKNREGKYSVIDLISLLSEDGKVYTSGRDITDLVNREKELEKLLLSSRLINETITDGLLYTNTNNDVEYTNEIFCKMMECDIYNMVGKNFCFETAYNEQKLCPKLSCELADKKICDLYRFDKNKSDDFDPTVKKVQRKNGEYFWAEIKESRLKDMHGNVIGTMATFKDITLMKIAEVELRKSLHDFEQIFSSITDVYFQTDLEGKVTIISPSVYKFSGFKVKEVIGNYDWSFFEDKEQYVEILRALDTKTQISQKINLISAKSEVKTVILSVKQIFNVDGLPIGRQGSLHDITFSEILQNERRLLVDDLNEKVNKLMQYNYIISHNLRSPIANILGLTKVLKENNLSDKLKMESIEHLWKMANSSNQIILDLNKILAINKSLSTEKEETDFVEILHLVSNVLENEIAESKAVITTSLDKDAKLIYTVKSFLESVIFNLISNSIKYKRKDVCPEINISTSVINNMFNIKFTDNGIGFNMAKNSNDIFGLYKRFNTEKEGKGLGLHITKAHIEALGGTIKLESELGVGSTFIINIPITSKHETHLFN